MLKTDKNIKTGLFLVIAMFLLANHVSAQSIIFSSDQWPKRWERAMNDHSMNGFVAPPGNKPYRRIQADKNSNGIRKVAQQSGWGKQPDKLRHKHKRSRTPEYHNGTHHNYNVDTLKQRYALPSTNYGLYGHGAYQNYMYGSAVPVIPHLPVAVYPTPLYGSYPGMYPGIGMSGWYNAPGVYPYGGYPGVGFPW